MALSLVPHDPSGLSLARLGMLGLFLSVLVLSAIFAIHIPPGLSRLAQLRYALALGILAIIIACAQFLLRYSDPVNLLPWYQRLSPLLWLLSLLALQSSIFLLLCSRGFDRRVLGEQRSALKAALVAALLLFAVLLFVVVTRIGLRPDSAYWGEPGPPILGWQFAIALLGGFLVFLLGLRKRAVSILDLTLPFALWLAAAVIWLSVPIKVMQNSFYAPIDPPAHQPFPNSDAGYYDSMAESLLLGYPYQGDIPTRPLYIVGLAVLHFIVGERYDLIIAGQTLVLAVIPVVFYFLGRKLHGRVAGVVIALLAIFRELTGLLISSQTRVSNSKTLLVDLPTLLLIGLACLCMLRWLERKDRNSALMAGGVFGLLLLLRTQSFLLLPLLIVLALFVFGIRDRTWVWLLLFFLGGVVIATAPWLLHNLLRTGQFTFDAPFQAQIIASQYKYTGNLRIQDIDLQGKSLLGILLVFALHDPGFVLGFIATHFFATQINGLLALPMFESYNGISAPLNLYWMNWNGGLEWFNLTLIVFYLAVISVGLGAAWNRLRWAGMAPLVFSLGYALANGVGRFSGWRYDLPADWVAYFYFGIGAAQLIAVAGRGFSAKAEEVSAAARSALRGSLSWPRTVLLALSIALLGSSPWLAEGWAKPRYGDQSPAALVTRLGSSSSVQALQIDRAQIEAFAASPQATLQIGRVLYPRFFSRNTGLASANPWPAYAVRDFPRMGFLLLNQTRHDAILPERQMAGPFPHGADVILLGCQRPDYVEVRLMLFPDADTVFAGDPLSVPCN